MHIAVHHQHGVIWTDGKGIYLAPIQVEQNQVQNAASVKLGEFEKVTSVHWSSNAQGDACHMCVVHQQNVTVWRVSGVLPRLNFKQVRKINVRPIPQGCLWNPTSDVLCLLSTHQCSFYYRHDVNKGSYAFPSLESGKILCGCWSPDGKKLILCVGAALLIYRWTDVSASVSDFAATAWRIPGLDGQVVSIAPVLQDSVVVAAEVPLETLCKQRDMFKMPEVNGNGHAQDDDVIRPKTTMSAANSLMNLEQNTQVSGDVQSSLTMVHLQDTSRDPIKLVSVPLKGVLTPDIIMYEKSSQCVVVGSNAQSQLHIYALLEKHLAYCGDIQLEKGQKPKGLCSMPTFFDDNGAALLILVGQRENEEAGLLTPATESEFKLSLKYIILKAGRKHRSRHKGRGESLKSRSPTKTSGLVKSESMKERSMKQHATEQVLQNSSESGVSDNHVGSRTKSPEAQLRIQSPSAEGSLLDATGLRTPVVSDHIIHNERMVEELSDSSDPPNLEGLDTETLSFSSQSASFHNSKLTDNYELSAAPRTKSKAMKEKNLSSHNSSPPNIRPAGILKISASKQSTVDPITGKYSHSDRQSDMRDFPDSKTSERVGRSEQQPIRSSAGHANTQADHQVKHKESSESDRTTKTITALMSGRESPRLVSLFPNVHLPSIEEVKTEVVEPTRSLSNVELEASEKEDVLSDLGLSSSQHNVDSSWNSLERQIKSQKENIEALQRRVQELTAVVDESSCVFPTKYQDISKPEMVEVYCDKREGSVTKRFLLDNGRLKLETVKLAFGVTSVELWLDGIPCVLSSNIDGYIPMKFSPSSKLHITGLSDGQ